MTPEQQALADKLTNLQRLTVLGVVAGKSQRQAYYDAGGRAKNDSSADSSVSEMLKNPCVVEFMAELVKEKSIQSLSGSMVHVPPDLMESMRQIFPERDELERFVATTLTHGVCAIESGREFVAKQKATINSTKRYAVFYRSGFKCQACGASPNTNNNVTLHVDHILPKSLGGTESVDNLQTLCMPCNISKGNKFIFNHNEAYE
jgi:hypothetical protein